MAINQFVRLQSMIYSFNNSALWLGSKKVETPTMLVPQMARAVKQLTGYIDAPIVNSWDRNYKPTQIAELASLIKVIKGFELMEEVELYIAVNG